MIRALVLFALAAVGQSASEPKGYNVNSYDNDDNDDTYQSNNYGKDNDSGYGQDDNDDDDDSSYGKKKGYAKRSNNYGNNDDNDDEDTGYGKKSSYGKKKSSYGKPPSYGKKYAPEPEPTKYVTPEPTTYKTPAPTYYKAPATTPPPFVPPSENSYGPPAEASCSSTWKPNSAKYMAYVCSSLYASASQWATTNCAAYYTVTDGYNDNSLYQAHLCTYWTQRSVMRVVTSCFIEAHLRNEFIMKYGKDGAGKWWCKYSEFVNQVNDCYSSSLHYYPLGVSLNALEKSVVALNPASSDMPAFQFTGASVAMCAYYNKDQVYNKPQ